MIRDVVVTCLRFLRHSLCHTVILSHCAGAGHLPQPFCQRRGAKVPGLDIAPFFLAGFQANRR